MNEINQSTDSEHLLSALRADNQVALTAPFIRGSEVLIGYALSPDEGFCAVLPLNEFIAFCPNLYYGHMTAVAYHGLKRIWEFLDDRGLLPDRHEDKDIDINKIEDTKLLAYLLDPDSGREVEIEGRRVQAGLTLASMSARYLGEDYPYRNTDIYEQGPREGLVEILAHDARLVHRFAPELLGRMGSDLTNLYRHLELPLMDVLDRMRRVGIGVDGAACAQEAGRIEKCTERLQQEITDGADVDLRSDHDVFSFLVAHGVEFPDTRAYQWQKVSNRVLEEIAPNYPLVKKILELRDVDQELSFLKKAAGQERIHPLWGQTRSATSRLYARNPAVQNVSRELRHLFVPAPGHALIKADYSQAQMRILAHLSQDPELMRIFNDPNGDVHTETSEWLGLNDRNVAKEINFAICFGMGPAGLARRINGLREDQGGTELIDEATARKYIYGFYGRFPDVRAFFDEEWSKLKKLPAKERLVRSLMGRERRFPSRATAEIERQFRVTWAQQVEADLIKTAMLSLDREFRHENMGARIVMMIHDSIWVEAPQEEEIKVKNLMRRIMTLESKLDVPLEIDFQ